MKQRWLRQKIGRPNIVWDMVFLLNIIRIVRKEMTKTDRNRPIWGRRGSRLGRHV